MGLGYVFYVQKYWLRRVVNISFSTQLYRVHNQGNLNIGVTLFMLPELPTTGNLHWRGRHQYSWPPLTNYFRSAASDYQTYKTSYFNEEFNHSEPSPWFRDPCPQIFCIKVWSCFVFDHLGIYISKDIKTSMQECQGQGLYLPWLPWTSTDNSVFTYIENTTKVI